MTDGMTISVNTKYGEVIISAGKGAKRSYTWEGETLKTELVPRKKRWHGTLGLLDDNNLRPPHKDVTHMLIEECQIHYSSIVDATRRLNTYEGIEDIYRDDGLFIRFRKEPMVAEGKFYIDISVFQILIDHTKPTKLPGSQNSKIKVTYGS
ncbi:MAG: hypothetical protein J7K85_06885 [Anaerolineaceae bacterium]|nr:hypothetical protein [Anaerolineaceae bacterium]